MPHLLFRLNHQVHLRAGVVVALFLALTSPSGFASPTTNRKQEARSQFERAEKMREELNGRPPEERTRRDYQRVADAYRRVYYAAPASSKANVSVIAVAELLAEMGRQFQPGQKYLESAIREYEFLRHEYPGSKYRMQALFTIGQIYKQDLGDDDAARQAFNEFLTHYPRNSLAAKAKQALSELNQPKPAKKAAEAAREREAQPSTGDVGPLPAAQKQPGLALVTGIRHWSTRDYTRVAIDVDSEVKYEAGRVSNPDRIFFDLPNTKLASVLLGKSFDVQDGFLKKIRVAQYQPGYTRVVLEVAEVTEYSAFLLPNPYRLIIDIHGRQPNQKTQVGQARTPVMDEDAGTAPTGETTSSRPSETARSAPKSSPGSLNANASRAGASAISAAPGSAPRPSASGASASSARSRRKVVVDQNDEVTTSSPPPPASASKGSPATAAAGVKDSELRATAQPTTAPTAVEVAPRAKERKKTARSAAAEIPAMHEATPTLTGDRSLTRALGLKIGRIVIDAGHGGHDTGTIGPNGLMEKDLVLDVALRLGRLLETRLGADVIYTRDDDTFVPLETRTAIANEHQADLFVSVHANSSRDRSARGVETYYLNFTSDPGALEVAARENAVSEKSIFELQDLVKKITLKEKIEESRELATDVQQSLYSGLRSRRSTLHDRGVKKAPFVVLIGANMPSILAEISFVSNPTDAAKLKTPAYRQKIADAMYKGIAKYASGLSGIKVASKLTKDSGE
jgi:N-acetylmuramoyl-L-alanine amidase